MTDDPASRTDAKPKYDLEERTALFGEAVIVFAKKVPKTPVTLPIISQLVKASTSIGANYCEADDGVSRNDFRHRISICRKEAKESGYFLRLLHLDGDGAMEHTRAALVQESMELTRIFGAIVRKSELPPE